MLDDITPDDIDKAHERQERILRMREALLNDFNISPEKRALRERLIANMEEMGAIPDDHQAALEAIDDSQPRSLQALNLLEKERAKEGGQNSWTEWRADDPPKGPTLH